MVILFLKNVNKDFKNGPNNNFLQLEIKSIKKHIQDLAFVANNKSSIKGTFFCIF